MDNNITFCDFLSGSVIIVLIMLSIYIILNFYENENKVYTIENYDNSEHNYTPDELYQHLSYVSNLLTNNNIKHWIMFGTLLGGVRQNNIIDYDYDFDLGANVNDANKIMALNNKIKKDGYSFSLPIDTYGYDFYNGKEKIIWRVSIKIIYNDIIMGDIYLFKKFDDGIMRRFDIKDGIYMTPNISFPSWFVENLSQVKIRNKQFPAPRDSEILLEHWYGKTWKIPIKAKAQGGNGDENSDYYGMSNQVKLDKLINYVKKYGVNIHLNLNEKIKYYCPYNQKQWIYDNEKIY